MGLPDEIHLGTHEARGVYLRLPPHPVEEFICTIEAVAKDTPGAVDNRSVDRNRISVRA